MFSVAGTSWSLWRARSLWKSRTQGELLDACLREWCMWMIISSSRFSISNSGSCRCCRKRRKRRQEGSKGRKNTWMLLSCISLLLTYSNIPYLDSLSLRSVGGTRDPGSTRKARPSGATGTAREDGSRWSSRYPGSCGQYSLCFAFIYLDQFYHCDVGGILIQIYVF